MSIQHRIKNLIDIIQADKNGEVRYAYFLRLSKERQIVKSYKANLISKRECDKRLIQCLSLVAELEIEKVLEYMDEPCYIDEPNRKSALTLITKDHYEE